MHKLSFEIDYAHERTGWMKCCLEINGLRHELEASYVFPPFIPLLMFVRDVAIQRLPASFEWDEEGTGAVFLATPLAEDSPFVHLYIMHNEADEPWLDADIEREAIIRAFVPPIVDLSKNFRRAEAEWCTPRQAVNKLLADVDGNIPPRSDIHHPRTVGFVVKGDYKTGSIEGHVFLGISLFKEDKLRFLMFDTHPFWQEWVDFLGNIASGEIPAQCEYIRVVKLGPNFPTLITKTLFSAHPVNNSENFHLKVITQNEDDGEFLQIHEVLNRQQFAQDFAKAFMKFLSQSYQPMPDKEGNTFNLRALPLNRLTTT